MDERRGERSATRSLVERHRDAADVVRARPARVASTSVSSSETTISVDRRVGAACRARSPRSRPRRRRGSLAPAPAAAPARRRRRRAVDLRGPLAHPLAAVRALRHVRADLGPAVLADDEEVRLRSQESEGTRPAAAQLASGLGPSTGPAPSPPRSPPSPRGGRGWPRRPPPGGRRRCRSRAGPRCRRAPRPSRAPRRAARSRSSRRRASSLRAARGRCPGRSTSSPSSPWRAASHLFSSSIS